MTLKNYYRRRPTPIREAEARGLPVYVLKNNTILQMQQSLANMFDLDVEPDDVTEALAEAENAIEHVLTGQNEIDLSPQNAYVRRLQHQMAERFNLGSRSRGKDPHRRVQIFREREA